jgi:integration host factor subunit beta
MIRSELVLRIAEMNPHLYAKDVEATVDAILDRIEAALIQGDRVELRSFGVFSVRHREARTKRNPRSGAAVQVGQRVAIHFKPAKVVRERLNLGETDPEGEAERFRRAS